MTRFHARAARARSLAARFPEAAQALTFYADVATLQSESGAAAGADFLSRLVELVSERAPDPLKRIAAELDPARAIARYRSGEDRISAESFFARILLQLELGEGCRGEHAPPQVAVLRAEGDGTALSLGCPLCFGEWSFPRAKCPACGSERDGVISRLSAPELPQVEVRACEDCRRYLNLVRLDVEPLAIPDVDDMAALALDIKARTLGLEKMQPNLVGM